MASTENPFPQNEHMSVTVAMRLCRHLHRLLSWDEACTLVPVGKG